MTFAPVSTISPPSLPPRPVQRPIEVPLMVYLGGLSRRSRDIIEERLRAVTGVSGPRGGLYRYSMSEG